MIAAAVLVFAAQQALSVDEVLAQSWEAHAQYVYSQVLDENMDGDRRARLAEYAIIFDGHAAISAFSELLTASTTPSLLHALLREWHCCVEAEDRELLITLATSTKPRTAFLALRNLVVLAESASDYIELIDIAARGDIQLATKLLNYLPQKKDDGSFRDYLSAQLVSVDAEYRAAMLNKAAEYHSDASYLELYKQLVSSNDDAQQILWMPSIARRASGECKDVAVKWLLSTQDDGARYAAHAVAKYLSTSDALDGYEELYMQHSLLTYEQSCALLLQRVAGSASATDFAIEHFDAFPSLWQIKTLELLSNVASAASREFVNDVVIGTYYSDEVRAAAIRSLVGQHARGSFPESVSEMLKHDFDDYAISEALVETALSSGQLKASELMLLLEQQGLSVEIRSALQRVIYSACQLSGSLENDAFLLSQWSKEIIRIQQQSENLSELASLSAVPRVDSNFNALLNALVVRIGADASLLNPALDGDFVNQQGAILLIYAAARFATDNPDMAFKLLNAAAHRIDADDVVWRLRLECLMVQYGNDLARVITAAEWLLKDIARLNTYAFAVRESFAPQGAGWRDLERGISHRKVFAVAEQQQTPLLCSAFLDKHVEADLLLDAAQMCSLYQRPRQQDVLTLAVSLAQHAVDLSPYSAAAHQKLVDCNRIAKIDPALQHIAAARLRRIKTNR
jgi:hypothetical protein